VKYLRALHMPILLLLSSAFSACGSPASTFPEPLPTILIPSRPAETDISTPLVPSTSFEPAVYSDPILGIELDYPRGWMLDFAQGGERASQAQISSWQHSSGDPVTGRPEGSTLVNVTTYLWEPQNDLAAYIAQRKLAWGSSGFGVLSEEWITLKDGWRAVVLMVQFPEGPAFYLFTYVGSSYVEVSGEGDLDLVRQIALTLRPLGRL